MIEDYTFEASKSLIKSWSHTNPHYEKMLEDSKMVSCAKWNSIYTLTREALMKKLLKPKEELPGDRESYLSDVVSVT